MKQKKNANDDIPYSRRTRPIYEKKSPVAKMGRFYQSNQEAMSSSLDAFSRGKKNLGT